MVNVTLSVLDWDPCLIRNSLNVDVFQKAIIISGILTLSSLLLMGAFDNRTVRAPALCVECHVPSVVAVLGVGSLISSSLSSTMIVHCDFLLELLPIKLSRFEMGKKSWSQHTMRNWIPIIVWAVASNPVCKVWVACNWWWVSRATTRN